MYYIFFNNKILYKLCTNYNILNCDKKKYRLLLFRLVAYYQLS